ncbi:MAG TPA: glycosyl hydrolase family 28-related protein [Magnetospirillaceae bacterium]|jgi:hypothetical protein
MDRRSLLTAMGGVFAAAAGTSAVTAITTTPAAATTTKASPSVFDYGAVGNGTTDDSAAFSAALKAAALGGFMVQVPAATYAIANPITWTSTTNVGQNWGFQCQGATLVSKITNGADIMKLVSVNTVRYFRIVGGLSIVGSGSDGNGIHLQCLGSAIYFYNNQIDAVSIENVGANGLLFEGNVFESVISNSYFQNAKKSGAVFAQSQGGVCSAINVISCFLNQNGQYGLFCTNYDSTYGGTTDVRVYGGYCRDNQSFGFYYNNGTGGTSCIEQVGFENNCRSLSPGDPNGAHIYALSSLNLRNVGGYNQPGGATYMVRGYFTGLTVFDGCSQSAGGAMLATGKSRLVQVNGTSAGYILMRACGGGVDIVSGTACGWTAQNCTGVSPRGNLAMNLTV